MSENDEQTGDASSEVDAEQAAEPLPASPDEERNAWLQERYIPSDEDKQQWDEMGFPPHIDIVAGFLMTNNLVFGVPEKAELFRLNKLTRDGDQTFGGPDWLPGDDLRLHYVQPTPLPFVLHTMSHPPFGMEMGDIVEVNYNVRLQALVRRMWLVGIKVIHGSETDDSPKVVFEATELPGAASNREIRVVRITVHNPHTATWEELAKTTYPRSIF